MNTDHILPVREYHFYIKNGSENSQKMNYILPFKEDHLNIKMGLKRSSGKKLIICYLLVKAIFSQLQF